MSFHGRRTVAAICTLSAWLGLCLVSGPNCQAQQHEAETGLEESHASGGDPPPPGAVVHIQESNFLHPEKVRWTAFSPDSRTLLSVGGEILFQWDVSASELLSRTALDGIERDQPVRLSPDGEVLVSVGIDDFQSHLWSVETGQLQHTIDGFNARLGVLGFSPDSKLLVTKPLNRPVIQVWSVVSGKKVREWDTGAGSMRAARILADNQSLVIASDNLVVRRWNYRTGELLAEKTLETHSKIHTTGFSPDGELLVVVGPPWPGGGVGEVYHVQTGQELSKLEEGDTWGHLPMSIVGFLPDSKTMITNSGRKVIELWDMPSGKRSSSFLAEADEAFLSPDGRRLAIRPDTEDWGREVQIWNPKAGRQLSTPRMRTYLRPVMFRLAKGDPMRVAIHWADGWGRIPAAGRYVGQYSQPATLETMELRVITPRGMEYHLRPKIGQLNTEFLDDELSRLRHAVYELPSIFLELSDDGFNTLVLGHSGRWGVADAPSFNEIGEYRLMISGSIIIDGQEPIPFQTSEVRIERTAESVLPTEEIGRRALTKLQEVLGGPGGTKIFPDKGGHGEYAPLHVVGLPTHERVVLLAVERPTKESGRLIDHYRVVVNADGTVVDITHSRRSTCLAAGTPVETRDGQRPIEQLQPGDRVWSYDLEADRPLLTTVQAVHRGDASSVLEINSSLSATAEHPVYANGEWTRAEDLRQGDALVGMNGPQVIGTAPRLLRRKTAVVDLTVDGPHNFFAGGLLVHNKSVAPSPGFFDRWQVFHVAASPYTNQIWPTGEK